MAKRKQEITSRYRISQPDKYTLKEKPKSKRDLILDSLIRIEFKITDGPKGKTIGISKSISKYDVSLARIDAVEHIMKAAMISLHEKWATLYREA
jgi:hypothetical protein